jgi:hypothetical protein
MDSRMRLSLAVAAGVGAWVSRSSLVKTDSTSRPLSLQAFQRFSSQARSPARESLSPVGQSGAVEHVHGEVGRRAVVQLNDPVADVGGLVVGEGPIPGEVPGTGTGEEVERQPRTDVDAVQLVSVLVAVAGDDPADVTAPGGVLLVSQSPGHQGLWLNDTASYREPQSKAR